MQLLHDANRYRDRNKIRRIENGAGQIANIGQRRTSVNPLFRITQARIGHKVALRRKSERSVSGVDAFFYRNCKCSSAAFVSPITTSSTKFLGPIRLTQREDFDKIDNGVRVAS
jgi:hypothetical protein